MTFLIKKSYAEQINIFLPIFFGKFSAELEISWGCLELVYLELVWLELVWLELVWLELVCLELVF